MCPLSGVERFPLFRGFQCTNWGKPERAPHGWYICDFSYIYYRTYVGVCVNLFFFFLWRALYGLAYTQYKVHAYSILKWIPLIRERSVYSAGENVKDLAALLKQLRTGGEAYKTKSKPERWLLQATANVRLATEARLQRMRV